MRSSRRSSGGARTERWLIRPCGEAQTVLKVINAAAVAYRGVIPPECWHEPYMTDAQLRAEIAAGVSFIGCHLAGTTAGVMGIQCVRNVDLIRHAYVLPAHQGQGLGSALIRHLRARTAGQLLVGTWAAAAWAIAFYEIHGFEPVPQAAKKLLLRAYWTVPDRQIEASVVLAAPPLTSANAAELVQRSLRKIQPDRRPKERR